MRSDGILRHALIALVMAAVFYVLAYGWIQHRRTVDGPWVVQFSTDARGHPSLAITEAKLKIARTITFSASTLDSTNTAVSLRFAEPVTNLPFGKMIFQDPTFLPGTVTMSQFGHEIELLPRVLIIDKKEIRWHDGQPIDLR